MSRTLPEIIKYQDVNMKMFLSKVLYSQGELNMEENPSGNEWQSHRRKGEDRSRQRRGAEGSKSFSVEAKTFIVDLGRLKGPPRGVIEERR